MSSDKDSFELQKAFDAFCRYSGNNEGKLSGIGVKQWMQNAGIIGEKETQISEEDADKCIPESAINSGMDYKQFQQYIQDIAKDKGIDANGIKSKLSSAIPTQVNDKVEGIKSKLSGK